MDGIKALVARLQASRPARVFQHYSGVRGPILASGLAYQALFAVFAAIWVGFSIAGLVIAGDTGLQQRVISVIAGAVPGLIDAGSGGAIDPKVLLQPGVFSWTGLIALVGLLVTALGFLASLRDGIRVVFDLPALKSNPVLQKLKDLGVGLGFAIVLVVSAALSFLGTSATSWLLDAIGIGSDSVAGAVAARILSIAIMFAIDAVTLGALYRVLSGVAIPWSRLRGGALIGAAGLGVLKILFSAAIIGGVGNNPLLKSFAVILGLLIFFNFVCQVILLAASWIAVGLLDRGIDVDPLHTEQTVLDARRLLLDHGLVSGRPVERRGGRIRIETDN
jgi:membrane protein